MNSRKSLWLVLGAMALPLLAQGIGGCSFESPGPAIIVENAYTCGCTCNSSPRNRAFPIPTNPDDAEQEGVAVNPAGVDLDIGSAAIVGLRFTNLGIPAGAQITGAFVQFSATENESGATNVEIVGELSPAAAPFVAMDNNLSNRTPTVAKVAWTPGAWAIGQTGPAQRTPDLTAVVQELVNQDGWNTASPVVIRIAGTGQRSAVSRNANATRAAVLNVTFVPSIQAEVPVCASQEVLDQKLYDLIPPDVARADCQNRVTNNLKALGASCGYDTSSCTCDLVVPETGNDGTYDTPLCADPSCALVPTDATCSNFNPNGFWDCIMAGGTQASCAGLIAANGVTGGTPVCTALPSKPGMAARFFGNNSTCEVSGTSQIEVGDEEPTHDPMTVGKVNVLGDPCPGGGCRVAAGIGLGMDPITFSVRFASDPMFYDLSAAGNTGLTTLAGQNAVFGANTVAGTGNGRRGATGMAVTAMNQNALTLGIDWAGKGCDLNGNLATVVDGEVPDEGVCEGDGATACTADSPDCDEVGGPCVLVPQGDEQMAVDVSLAGTLTNQPPKANAGADQTVECTSTSGASFRLQGTATDPDNNVAVTSWRSGSRVGPEVSNDLVSDTSLGVGVAKDFVLRVVDGYMQGDEDVCNVKVVDTTPPQLSLSVSPNRMSPPNHALILITATIQAIDTCDATPAVRLVSITSNEPDNGLGDGDLPNDVQGAAFGTDDRQFLLRRERGGLGKGRVYTITYSATDASGNATKQQATVTVPK